ncbi:threonylcarbamoyladenylate synthase [Ascoidea rubescens DSM 1968]|uniref:Threonylcarbamoyl-AMP synthase n=1 Tax=Ascoidea rubescens DSM 1968 TaxID=1344418 RepID=A0A1D2VHJ5_9ASCO|nr:translation factor [Ascoidea rubescens DSM 1968]ODV61141.1 translation factor [Ascoidea rubescens DSM 1968]
MSSSNFSPQKSSSSNELSPDTKSFETQILKVNPNSITFSSHQLFPTISDPQSLKNLQLAAHLIKHNKIVGFPTETVYGLGGSSLSDSAVTSIYKAKNRPADNPLITHISSIDQLKRLILSKDNLEIPDIYLPLIQKYWPGPLTILLPVGPNSPISKLTTNGLSTFAVRMPSNPIARALIALSDTPIAAPSANSSTKPSPTLASHVYHDLNNKIPLIIDGGPSNIGLESTVIDGLSTPPVLLRPGGLSVNQIKNINGFENLIIAKPNANSKDPVKTPGMKYKHYSPSAKVSLLYLNKNSINFSQPIQSLSNYLSNNLANNFSTNSSNLALIYQDNILNPNNYSSYFNQTKVLGKDINQMQHNLFALFRELDDIPNINQIIVILDSNIKNNLEAMALLNRLNKAASIKIDL